MRLRTAAPGDAEAIAATLRDAFAEFEPLYTPAAFAATTPTAARVRDRLREGPIWVAEQRGVVLGTVSAVPRPAELYVRSMAVRPAARGQGVGVRLLHAVETFAEAHGYRRLVLSTTPFLPAALRLYEREGFRRTGESLDLFGTPLLAMTKELPAG